MRTADPAYTPSGVYDVAVIGGGVIGCAIARRFALDGARVALLEKAPDLLDGASKGNSAILHTGFDAPPDSLEASCIAEGYREYLEIHERLGLPLIRSGALVIAWDEAQEAALPALIDQAHANGVRDVEPLSREETLKLEPNLAPTLRASFRVPREYLIDPWSAPLAYALQAVAHGAEVFRSCAVTGGAREGDLWRLDTPPGPLSARLVINAGGLWGDLLDERLLGRRDFTIRPRKGQFVVYDKPAAGLAGHILLPVPTSVTKGVVVCRTAYGNLLVGPTAEEQEDRERAALDHDTLRALRKRGEEILPALAGHEVTAVYAGLRPATEFKDYRIAAHAGGSYISVGGIRSTGLSSALGTAAYVSRLAAGHGHAWDPPEKTAWPRVPNISAAAPRDWQSAGNGGIVCHCELVTRREIEAALSGPLAARSLAGLKRRTRVTMGRCQGFHCLGPLARMTQGRFDAPIAAAAVDG
jgi:glycerol-3-phosphate dehydrogenase